MCILTKDFKPGDTVYYYKRYEGDKSEIVSKIKEGRPEFWLEGEELDKIPKHSINNWGKIVKEVSPEATYVEEGQEFNDSDLNILKAVTVKCVSRSNKSEHEVVIGNDENYYEGIIKDVLEDWIDKPEQYGLSIIEHSEEPHVHIIKVKGPCGHFH